MYYSYIFSPKVDSEGNHLRGNFGYCGTDCSEEEDGEEFDKEVSFNPLSGCLLCTGYFFTGLSLTSLSMENLG